MAKSILLHIGSHKTGSTSIQRALALASHDGSPVCYPLWPEAGRFKVSGALQDVLTPLYLAYEKLPGNWYDKYPTQDRRFTTMLRRYRRFIFNELRSANTALVSNEDFSYFTPAATRRLRDDLESVGFREFYIVLYIRDPADYFLSMFHSVLKLSLGIPPRGHDPASFRYEFRRTAETWEQVFPGRVTVRHYRTDREFDVLQDFASVVELRLGAKLSLIPIRHNTTLSAEGLQIMQDYRHAFWPDNGGVVTPDAVRLYNYLQNSTMEVRQTKPVLKASVAEHIRASHQTDAEAIRSRYGLDLGLEKAERTLEIGQAVRIADMVESLDPQVVENLLLGLARTELGRGPAKRSLPTRIARRAYREVRTRLPGIVGAAQP